MIAGVNGGLTRRELFDLMTQMKPMFEGFSPNKPHKPPQLNSLPREVVIPWLQQLEAFAQRDPGKDDGDLKSWEALQKVYCELNREIPYGPSLKESMAELHKAVGAPFDDKASSPWQSQMRSLLPQALQSKYGLPLPVRHFIVTNDSGTSLGGLVSLKATLSGKETQIYPGAIVGGSSFVLNSEVSGTVDNASAIRSVIYGKVLQGAHVEDSTVEKGGTVTDGAWLVGSRVGPGELRNGS